MLTVCHCFKPQRGYEQEEGMWVRVRLCEREGQITF